MALPPVEFFRPWKLANHHAPGTGVTSATASARPLRPSRFPHEHFSLKLFARDAPMPGTADLRILRGRRMRGDHQAFNGYATPTARSWPAAEIDSKPKKLTALTFAEFAYDRFAALCREGAIGHNLPLVAFVWQSVERLLHTKTSRTGNVCNSANAAVASVRHGLPLSIRHRPLQVADRYGGISGSRVHLRNGANLCWYNPTTHNNDRSHWQRRRNARSRSTGSGGHVPAKLAATFAEMRT
jgi:hypothetical protein